MREVVLALTLVVVAVACKTIREELPTQPDPTDESQTPQAAGPTIPAAPTPSPSPIPEDQAPLPATPGSGGGGGGGGEGGGGSGSCGEPVPPGISRVNVKVFAQQPGRVMLDATPLVGPDETFCRLIGYTDDRLFCPVRPPGHPERTACEALRVGAATDTGRIGPTWSAEGRPCQGESPGASCLNHPDNQYLVYAYGAGTFRACATGGACGQITLP